MTNCQIIKDLIPLYEEDLLSEESKVFVEEHLKTCESCKNLITNNVNIEKNLEHKPLEFLEKSIKKEKNKLISSVAFGLLAIFVILINLLTRPIYFENNGDLYDITLTEDKVFIEFADYVTKTDVYYVTDELENNNEIFIESYTTTLDKFLNKFKNETLSFERENNVIFYSNHEKVADLIYGNFNDGIMMLPRLALNMYNAVALGIYLLMLVIYLILKFVYKKKINDYKALYIMGIPVCYLLGFFSIKGLSGISYHILRDLIFILITGFAYYLLLVSVIKFKNSKL